MVRHVAVVAAALCGAAACGGPLLVGPPAASVRAERPAVIPLAAVQRSEVTATVLARPATGRLVAAADTGLLVLPIGSGCDATLEPGAPVRIVAAVQEVAVVTTDAAPDAPSPAPGSEVSRAPPTYSTTIGRILTPRADGRLSVSTPGGPITVWLPPRDWRPDQLVQVWTWIEPTRGCKNYGARAGDDVSRGDELSPPR